jgi:formylglycine-generating enzyme required for sulfatase activity
LIANSGWNADWNTSIAKTATELVAAVQCSFLDQTWDETGANDWLPMNCVSWYEAFAFCAWDGGRLPTEAEWEYAAAGGEDERVYPWGNSSPLTSLVVYGCQGDEKSGCTLADIPPVGSFATGVGKYGQLDMAGSMREWVLDWYAQSYSTPCNDCANVVTGQSRVSRGGDWYYNAEYLRAAYRSYEDHASHFNYMGLRCARNLP